MRSGQYILIFILLIFTAHNLYSQFQGRPYVINHNPDQFRMDNQNWSISTDDQGITYIGNNRGLFTFDGSNWDFYEMPEGMVVRSVRAVGDSIVYVGSYEEFGYWKRDGLGRMTYHSLSDTLDMSYFHNDEIWRIVPHRDKIYFQSFSNIYVYDGQDIETFNPDDNLVLLMKARDRLFIHMVGRGLCEIKNGKFQLVPGSEKFAQDEIKAIMPYGDDRFLIGASAGGLYIYDGKTFEKWDVPAADQISEAEVNAGLSFGKLKVIGTLLEGIFILHENGRLKEHLHTGNFLSNNTILSLSKTSDGNLWAGLDRGLDYISLASVLD